MNGNNLFLSRLNERFESLFFSCSGLITIVRVASGAADGNFNISFPDNVTVKLYSNPKSSNLSSCGGHNHREDKTLYTHDFQKMTGSI